MPSVLIDGVLVSTGDPSTLYAPKAAEGTKTGPARVNREKVDQSKAITALIGHLPSVLYAVRFPDGIIKIGCSTKFAQRLRCFRGKGAEVLGFTAGDLTDEQKIHDSLTCHLDHGREYYRPTAEVLAVVNRMRDEWKLPHVAA